MNILQFAPKLGGELLDSALLSDLSLLLNKMIG